MNGFAALDIPPCRRYVVVKATAGFAVCRLILKLLLFYSCLDFTQNLGKTRFWAQYGTALFSLQRAYATFSPSRNNCFRSRSMTAKRHCRHGSGWKVLPLWQRSPLHSLSAGGSCCTGVQTGGERWCAGQASLRYCSSCCLPYFRFWYCFCVERGLISLLPLFSVIAFLYGFFSLYLLYFFKQF